MNNVNFQDIHIHTLTLNSQIEKYNTPNINNRYIVEGSDEIDINTTMIVREDNASKTFVEIGNIFDEDIHTKSNTVTLIETCSPKDTLRCKNIDQGIDIKHLVVRKEITEDTSTNLIYPIESQGPTTVR